MAVISVWKKVTITVRLKVIMNARTISGSFSTLIQLSRVNSRGRR